MYFGKRVLLSQFPRDSWLAKQKEGNKNKFIMLLEKKDGVKLMVRQPNGQHKKEIGYWL